MTKSMESYQHLIDRYYRISKGEESYGDGEPSAQAHRFRMEEMMEAIVTMAKENTRRQGGVLPEVDLLVSIVGFSPATTILAFRILEPRSLVVIRSDLGKKEIDEIDKHLIKAGHLQLSEFQQHVCDPVDPKSIYQVVKTQIDQAKASLGKSSGEPRKFRTVIDITGGKKVMSASAALAAWQLDLDICYIDSHFDNRLKQPKPGSESLLWLNNPMTIFGQEELKRAADLFRGGAYGVASQRYEELANRLMAPEVPRFLSTLASLYQAWANLDLDRVAKLVQTAQNLLKQPPAGLDSATAIRILEQVHFLQRLADKKVADMHLAFFLLGRHYMELGRPDFAAMLFYRTIEGCFKDRLEKRFDSFSCISPDYSLLMDPTKLQEAYRQLTKKILKEPHNDNLPNRIGCVHAGALLFLVNDPLMKHANLDSEKALGNFVQQTDIRNRSILAHGNQTVKQDQCKKFENLAMRVLEASWILHHPDGDFRNQVEKLQFLREVSGLMP